MVRSPTSLMATRRLWLFGGRHPMICAVILGGVAGFFFGYLLLSTRPFVQFDRIQSIEKPSVKCEPQVQSKKAGKTLGVDEAVAEIQNVKRRLISSLHNETRLLCWVMSEPKGTDKRAAVMETWGKRCHLTLFMVGAKDMLIIDKKLTEDQGAVPSIPPKSRRQIAPNAFIVYLNMTRDHYDDLWSKTRLAFVYVYEHFRDAYDWLLKVDDDSFVIIENLRLFLRDKKVEDPFYYGCQYSANAPRGYASGGPGYVMSRINVDKFVSQLKRTNAIDDCLAETPNGNGPEDVRVGQCLDKLGIGPSDTRDDHGRFRYLPFTPENVLNHETLHPRYNWFWGFSAHKLANGFECCSDTAISFHYITPPMMRVMEYMIYYVHPFSSRELWNNNATDTNLV